MRTIRMLMIMLALVLAASWTHAQTISCSVSGVTTKQAEQYGKLLAEVNKARARQIPPLPPLADFSAHCADTMLGLFRAWVAQMNNQDASNVSKAAETHGDELAPSAHCTAAGLPAGCTKAQVACFVLTGNTACN